ncbi:ribosome rescue GTPase HflX [Solemya velum gill symbiont]|uniref:GTPase HflX n=4 Tax=Solemya velum gill symbiont TaxID=2340 RepID=A0A1T2NRK7_SOVGS|nr:ribosome rescue GTPase HflX [Solemya velum gill symbiont]OOY35890.1 GTPase HflX [Solemya velum gill symbiont]OOY38730.1 GTPase HflX [Solemya velum gill symbiont]OOY48538.1 GTPase HflX [Solemya velum gill symbiont]OOY52912.1 GTPase HflX [Solemya velum gill symbiont]OOY53504.1 GTPase HflX [Solemya velum gill symbiont]
MELFERPDSGERAVLVHVGFSGQPDEEELQEFAELAGSAGAEAIAQLTGVRTSPDSRTFIGKGKLEELKELLAMHDGELVIFDHELSPAQERNLEAELSCRVLDRSGLILDIFAQRARSFEGKLQVELAQLKHLSTRLVRGWTHLERQKGGIGLRGPGETQLETDRRLIGARITRIQKRLDKVDAQRELGRKARRRADTPTVSLVGYTNAGKSTLFNRLVEADVYAQDQLFATLDPTLRRLELPNNTSLVLADTVGFISRLPHELIAAFKSTLQETIDASLLLHVVDASNPQYQIQVAEVDDVLQQINAETIPQLIVMNKIDRMEEVEPRIERDDEGRPIKVWLSAVSGEGINLLIEVLAELAASEQVTKTVELPPSEGALRAALYREADILEEKYSEKGDTIVSFRMPLRSFNQLKKNFPLLGEEPSAE